MRYYLPDERTVEGKKNPEWRGQLGETITTLVDKGVSVRNPRSVEWQVNYHYLQGIRNFQIQPYRS